MVRKFCQFSSSGIAVRGELWSLDVCDRSIGVSVSKESPNAVRKGTSHVVTAHKHQHVGKGTNRSPYMYVSTLPSPTTFPSPTFIVSSLAGVGELDNNHRPTTTPNGAALDI